MLSKLSARAIAALVVVVAILGFGSIPASAADYGIEMNVACRYTYNNPSAWADFTNPLDPFSWVCRLNTYNIGVPPSLSFSSLGGVDMQKYCDKKRPGSQAAIVNWHAFGWKCRR